MLSCDRWTSGNNYSDASCSVTCRSLNTFDAFLTNAPVIRRPKAGSLMNWKIT